MNKFYVICPKKYVHLLKNQFTQFIGDAEISVSDKIFEYLGKQGHQEFKELYLSKESTIFPLN